MLETQRTPDPIDCAVGLAIRHIRKEQNITQKVLAVELGVTFQQVQKYERGTNRVSASVLVRIAKSLGVHPAAFLPTSDAPLPASDYTRMHIRGAEETLKAYAAIKSSKHRRAVLLLMLSMGENEDEDEEQSADEDISDEFD